MYNAKRKLDKMILELGNAITQLEAEKDMRIGLGDYARAIEINSEIKAINYVKDEFLEMFYNDISKKNI